MLLHKTKCFFKFVPRKPYELRKLNDRLKPKFSLAVLALNMHMNSRLFTRKEIETEPRFAKNCWAHRLNDYRNSTYMHLTPTLFSCNPVAATKLRGSEHQLETIV